MYQSLENQAEFAPAAPSLPLVADAPEPRRAAGVFSVVVSLALLAMVADRFRHLDFATVEGMIPRQPWFWLTFVAYYLAAPASEWVIYRRLWQLPVSGIAALLRKLVSNELLLGYLGEAQFYAWARSRTGMVAAPFGAIKDVTILSALTGNVATLGMLIMVWPRIHTGELGLELHSVFVSLSVVLVTSFAIMLFRQRLFSLPRRELWLIAGIHFVRIFALLGLTAVMWHIALPGVAMGMWLVLATLRMLVSRLPLIPNKDVVFAALAVYLLGNEVALASMLTMMAGLVLGAHLVVGLTFGLAGLVPDTLGRKGMGHADS